jgi:tRNA synthetases class II (D, K and N)
MAPGIGEIIGGSKREERLDVLDARMAERAIDKEHYGWYRDLRRYGTVPHRFRPRLRAHARVSHGPRQGARRDPVSPDAGECEVLRHRRWAST